MINRHAKYVTDFKYKNKWYIIEPEKYTRFKKYFFIKYLIKKSDHHSRKEQFF